MSTTERERREAASKKSPLTLATDFDYTKIPREKIDFQRADGSWGKLNLYSSDFSSCENVMACLTFFKVKCRELGIQGQDRFNYWRSSLQPTAMTTWEAAVAEGPNNFQEGTFDRANRVILSRLAGDGAYEALRDYLNIAKKPYKMNSSQLSVRLREIQELSSYFLDQGGTPGPRFTDMQVLNWMVTCHPVAWINNFKNAGKKARNETIPSLIEYFNEQASQETASTPSKKRSSTTSNNDNDSKKQRYDRNNNQDGRGYTRSYSRGGRGSGRGGGRSGRGNGGGRGQSSQQQRGIDPNAHCPVHPNGNHLWRKCTHNPRADDDAPKLQYYRNERVSNDHSNASNPGRGQQFRPRQEGTFFVSPPVPIGPGYPASTMYGSGGYGQDGRGTRSGDQFYAQQFYPAPGMSNPNFRQN